MQDSNSEDRFYGDATNLNLLSFMLIMEDKPLDKSLSSLIQLHVLNGGNLEEPSPREIEVDLERFAKDLHGVFMSSLITYSIGLGSIEARSEFLTEVIELISGAMQMSVKDNLIPQFIAHSMSHQDDQNKDGATP